MRRGNSRGAVLGSAKMKYAMNAGTPGPEQPVPPKPRPDEPVPQPPQPEVPNRPDPTLPPRDPEPLPFPVPGPADPGSPRPVLRTKQLVLWRGGLLDNRHAEAPGDYLSATTPRLSLMLAPFRRLLTDRPLAESVGKCFSTASEKPGYEKSYRLISVSGAPGAVIAAPRGAAEPCGAFDFIFAVEP